jgi:hypothetical protein
MTAHAKLSASGSARWLNCPGSVNAEKGIKDKSSFFAAEGTAAHALAEHCLINNLEADSQIGQTFDGFVVDNYMAEFVQSYVSYVKQFSGEHMYEVRVDFSPWVPEGFGTCDAMIIQPDGVLRVIDLKYGQGLRVDADENTQAMLYALGAYEDFGHIYDIETIEITIHQPRLDHVSEWSITVTDLLTWGEEVKLKAAQCLEPNAPRNASDKACQWCKAKPTCPALKTLTETAIITMFDDIAPATMPPADTLTDEQLKQALQHKKLITGWLDAVEAHIVDRLTEGQDFDGYKIVEGRSLRKWGDEVGAIATLSEQYTDDDLFKKSFLSVSQAEKLVGKKSALNLSDFIVKPPGKPTLAPESDKRPAINLQENDFDAC